eukprot:GILJ01001275.1.p1 GENE.GILJ01001275.1~~GILJ01001275.1.p1  ORF type:complete len:488 (+),score=89.05 GILJ01001275.1:48-1466(+)
MSAPQHMAEEKTSLLPAEEAQPTFSAKSNNSLKKILVVLVLASLYCDFLLMTIIIPIMPDILSGQDVGGFLVGVLFASKPVMQIISNPIVGVVTDMYGSRVPLLIGLLVLCASTAVYGFVTNYVFLLIARGIQGIASSGIMAGGMALIAATHSSKERGGAMGLALIGVAAGVLTGPLIGGVLYHRFGQLAPFCSVAGLLLLCAFVQIFVNAKLSANANQFDSLKSANQQPGAVQHKRTIGGHFRNLGKLLNDRYIMVIFMMKVLSNGIIGMLEPLIPSYLEKTFDMSTETTGLCFSATTLGYLVGTPLAGRLSDKIVTYKLMMGGSLATAVLLPFVIIYEHIAVTVSCLFVIGIFLAFVNTPAQPTMAQVVEYRKMTNFGSAFAVTDLSGSLGFTIGPLVGPAIASITSFQWTLVTFAAVTIVLSPLMLIFREIQQPKTKLMAADNTDMLKEKLLPSEENCESDNFQVQIKT